MKFNMKTRITSLILTATAIIAIIAGCSTPEETPVDYDAYFGYDPRLTRDAAESSVPPNTTPIPEDYFGSRIRESFFKNQDSAETAVVDETAPAEISETTKEATTAATAAPETTAATKATTTTATTTKAATTTAATTKVTTTATAPAAPTIAPPAVINGINNQTFIVYTSVKDTYHKNSGNITLFNFNKTLSSGVGVDGTILPTEADYGVKAAVNGRKITFTAYNHTDAKSVTKIIWDGFDKSYSAEETNIIAANNFSIDTSSLTNGLYIVNTTFSTSKTVPIFFYVNGNETWLCERANFTSLSTKDCENRYNSMINVLKKGNVTPENSLSLDKVWYPFKVLNEGERCDTQLWIDLSKTFVDDSWSDEHKLYAIQAWIRENIAYDKYVSDTLHISRAQYHNDLTGAQSVYDLRAGVCLDYANIVNIICRAHGIPAVTIGCTSKNHVWNAVYVNNRWMEYDACMSNQYRVYEDTANRLKTHNNIYSGIYSPMINNIGIETLPADAEANKYFQQNSLYLY